MRFKDCLNINKASLGKFHFVTLLAIRNHNHLQALIHQRYWFSLTSLWIHSWVLFILLYFIYGELGLLQIIFFALFFSETGLIFGTIGYFLMFSYDQRRVFVAEKLGLDLVSYKMMFYYCMLIESLFLCWTNRNLKDRWITGDEKAGSWILIIFVGGLNFESYQVPIVIIRY